MPLLTLPAHFDGERICLDEPFVLRPDTRLMVVVLPESKEETTPVGVRLGDLPRIFKSLPRLSDAELNNFAKDLDAIRRDDYWITRHLDCRDLSGTPAYPGDSECARIQPDTRITG